MRKFPAPSIPWLSGLALAWLLLVFPCPIFAAGEPAEPTEARLAKFISQLGATDFHTRQRAQEEFVKIGFPAIDALTEASDHDDLEIAERAKYLLKLIKVELVHEGDPATVKRWLESYETADADQRVIVMNALAREPRGQGLDALCRLVCFEKSLALSRQAALVVLSMPDPEPGAWPKRAKTILDAISGSRRPGAKWLRTLTKTHSDPAAALLEWEQWIAEEQSHLPNAGATGEATVAALLRRQAVALEKLDRREEALAAIRKLIAFEKGNPTTLAELLQWLAKHGSWDLITEVAQRFDRTIQQDIWLCYVLADARAQQGQAEIAAQLAEKAFNIPSERREQQTRAHLDAAVRLQRTGRFDWAEREYKDLITQPVTRFEGLQARLQFAEMLHDLDRDAEAASALSSFTSTGSTSTVAKLLDRGSESRTLSSVLARRQYFKALGMMKDKQFAGATGLLEQAYAADSSDADVLIALYRMAGDDPKKKADIVKKINAAATKFRQIIDDDTDSPVGYNQLAWLIANTEGDYNEALRHSLTSLELSPGAAGYLDTLAHCYFAKKDFANAVATQTRAVELEPHSGAIKRALERFQAAAKSQK